MKIRQFVKITLIIIVAFICVSLAAKHDPDLSEMKKEMLRELDKISPAKLRTENVIQGEEPEKFYIIKGKKAFVEIDGKKVEEYFRQ